jgi:phosphohistidine phosphatase
LTRLYLVRHGQAKPDTEDPKRPLSDQGRKSVEQMAAWVSQMGLQVNQIRHSGKPRAEETAIIFSRQLVPPNGVTAISGLAPNDEVSPIGESLKYETESLMLVGHLPFLSRLAGMLLVDDPTHPFIDFKTSGIACLQKEEGQWVLAWMVAPELLR